MITIKKFELLELTSNEWAMYHEYRRKIQLEDFPDEPMTDDKTAEEQLKSQMTIMGVEAHTYFIYDSEELVGILFFGFFKETAPSYKTNEKLAMFDIGMLKKYRRKGIATKALKIMVEICEKKNKSIFIVNSEVPETKLFFNAIGAKIAQVQAKNKLKFSEVNWNMINSWIEEGKQHNPKTKILAIKGAIPEKYLNEFLKTYNETGNLQPKDDLEMGEMLLGVNEWRKTEESDNLAGIITLTTFTIEENNEVSGFTMLRIIPGKEKQLSQNLTGVPIRFRNRKLGKWVKATMIKYVKENYPQSESIITGNAESNAAMLAINKGLGFKKYKETVMAQITIDDLKKYLNLKEIGDEIIVY